MERRITAILAADMVGYSRLMEADEVGTLARQKRHRIELIDPKIAAHGGQIIKLTGDGLIAEFPSVVEAVQCAVTIQAEMAAREADESPERQISYRIAINLGDVIFEDGDVYGDGVNIASRLETLADAGGVIVSGTAYDHLKANVNVGYEDLGEQQVKNIARPVRVWKVLLDPDQAGKVVAATRSVPRSPTVFGIAVLVLALALGGLWWWNRPDFAPARPEELAFAIPEKPSIAVTPFQNVTRDSELDWLVTGLSSNVISALTSSPDMIVISRNALDDMVGLPPGEIAERYGVKYVLDGTLQSDGNFVRVHARLSDALEGRALWSEKWDRTLEDVFAVQDEIADAILEELQVKLTLGEQARLWRAEFDSAENMRDMIRGRAAFQTMRPEEHRVMARHWDAIYARNPELPSAMNLQGWKLFHKVSVGLSDDPVADLETAREWSEEAIEAGGYGHPHILHASVSLLMTEFEKALQYAEQGIAADPGEADVVMIAGWVYARAGRTEEGIKLIRRAMRMEPDYPDWLATALSGALALNGDWAEAREVAEAILASDLKDVRAKPRSLMMLAVLSMWEGNEIEARRHMATLLETVPDINVALAQNLAQTRLLANQEFAERYIESLIAAGLPHER